MNYTLPTEEVVRKVNEVVRGCKNGFYYGTVACSELGKKKWRIIEGENGSGNKLLLNGSQSSMP